MRISICFILLLFNSCQENNTMGSKLENTSTQKKRPPVIEKEAKFIDVKFELTALNKDSILTSFRFTNNSNSDFLIYKPLLPSDNPTTELFVIVDNQNYKRVKYIGPRKEKYIDSKIFPSMIIPKLKEDNFVDLKAGQVINYTCNLANQYDFKSYLDNGITEFKALYLVLTPFVIGGKLQAEVDTVDKIVKPIYYYLRGGNTKDIDSMRRTFVVP
jgi:hypothetical protein